MNYCCACHNLHEAKNKSFRFIVQNNFHLYGQIVQSVEFDILSAVCSLVACINLNIKVAHVGYPTMGCLKLLNLCRWLNCIIVTCHTLLHQWVGLATLPVPHWPINPHSPFLMQGHTGKFFFLIHSSLIFMYTI